MKTILVFFLILLSFFISVENCFAQSFELAGTYTTSDANFYKNTPGVSFAYSHHFKKQFVFVEFKTSKKNDSSFATFRQDVTGYYLIQSVNGSFSASNVNFGAAQKIIASDCLEFSVGADAGLNFYNPDFNITSVSLDLERNEVASFSSSVETEKRKNKFGVGAFIDMELKNIFFDNFSIFSRLNINHVNNAEKHLLRGGGPFTSVDVNSISFRIGVKYRIPNAKE